MSAFKMVGTVRDLSPVVVARITKKIHTDANPGVSRAETTYVKGVRYQTVLTLAKGVEVDTIATRLVRSGYTMGKGVEIVKNSAARTVTVLWPVR